MDLRSRMPSSGLILSNGRAASVTVPVGWTELLSQSMDSVNTVAAKEEVYILLISFELMRVGNTSPNS